MWALIRKIDVTPKGGQGEQLDAKLDNHRGLG